MAIRQLEGVLEQEVACRWEVRNFWLDQLRQEMEKAVRGLQQSLQRPACLSFLRSWCSGPTHQQGKVRVSPFSAHFLISLHHSSCAHNLAFGQKCTPRWHLNHRPPSPHLPLPSLCLPAPSRNPKEMLPCLHRNFSKHN